MRITTGWDRFWFSSIDSRQYAALRIAFGFFSLVYFAGFLPYIDDQFSSRGWLSDYRQLSMQNGGSWSYYFINAFEYADYYAYSILIIGIFSAICMMFGWRSCLATSLTWLVWVSLWNRNPLIMDGDDAVIKVMCFYLLLSPCANSWSIDSLHSNKSIQATVWPLRLMQFQIALLYFVSGWVKFHSQEWDNGTVIQYVLIHPQYSQWYGWALLNLPCAKQFLAAIAWFIRWWELLFPVLLVLPYTRRTNLAIGVLFHFGLLITMNLRWFPLIMLALYLALIPNHWFLKIENRINNVGKNLKRKTP